MASSIFSRIVAGDIPCHKIAEDDTYLAFLDVFPLVKGHTLVIPKQEIDYIFDLSDDLLSGLHVFSKKVAHGIQAAVPCERIGMTVIGLEVPHAHVHLMPINGVTDMNFERPKLQVSPEELAETAAVIRQAL